MWTMRDPIAFYSLIAQIQPLLLLALVVELRQGSRLRRWLHRGTTRRGLAARLLVGLLAAGSLLYIGYVEFVSIALTASSDQVLSAEMDTGTLIGLLVPGCALLLVTGAALLVELFGEDNVEQTSVGS